MERRHFEMHGRWTAELLSKNGCQARYTPAALVIGFAFDSQVGIHAFGTDRRTGFCAKSNGLAFVPAGWTWTRRFSDAVDPSSIKAAQALRSLLFSGDAIDPLHCECLVQALEARATAMLSVRPGRSASWMTPTPAPHRRTALRIPIAGGVSHPARHSTPILATLFFAAASR